MLAEQITIERMAVKAECDRKCEDCEKYFDCDLPLKETFEKKGILKLIRENLKGIKHKVIVLGGKGGVGKSMVAVNLAAALVGKGRKVCLLDQVYDCPAIPVMTGAPEEARLLISDGKMIPYEVFPNLQIVSTGLFLKATDVIIWFHQMKRNATEELLAGVHYGEQDYLIVDIPTGTSSETVNALKYLPELDGGIVVTVGSVISQNVARKCVYMMKKAGVPVIGVVENESSTSCPFCHKPLSLIQEGAGEKMSRQENVPFLARIPLSRRVSLSLDEGKPLVLHYPDCEEAKALMKVAEAVIKHCEGKAGS